MIYEFKFSPEFLNLIVAGLAKLPFEQSAQAIQALQSEVQEQDAKAKAAAGVEAGPVAKRGHKPKAAEAANGASEQTATNV